MKKRAFLFIVVAWGILWMPSSSSAQPGYLFGEEPEPARARGGNSSVVKVYGPDELTELAGLAIRERRPDVSIDTSYQPLKNKVWIEGTTGSDYMPLSPKRVSLLQAARANGRSVYAALCSQQKAVIQNTVGMQQTFRREEYRTEARVIYVRPIGPPPPPLAVYVPPVPIGIFWGGGYPFYGYRGAGYWGPGRRPFFHGGWHRPWYRAPGGHRPIGFQRRGHR